MGKEKSLADVIKLLEKEGRSLVSNTESDALLTSPASEVDIEPYVDTLIERLGQEWIVRDAPLTTEEMFDELYERFQALKRGQQELLEELRALSESLQAFNDEVDAAEDLEADELLSQPMSPGPIGEQ